MIQADFLLSASREEIDASSPWNKALLENIPEAFRQAVDDFNSGDLRYTWIKFLQARSPFLDFFSSLDEAIEHEFERLHRAGVKAKFVHLDNGGAAEPISRPVQQLCFQVVREALSNVIRHARAKSVQVTIESNHAAVRVSISDDGRGIDNGKSDGTGLTGVRERLELMGGRLIVESRAGRTTVVAEIPESA